MSGCSPQKATALWGFAALLMPGEHWAVVPHCTGVPWGVPTGQQWEQGRVPPEMVGAGQGLSGGDLPQHPRGGHRGGLRATSVHPRPPPRGILAPLIPSRERSQGQARPPAQALHRGQHSRVPPSPLPPVADGSDIVPYHPYFTFPRVFLARPTHTEEALSREQALPWAGLAGETKQQPQPHCVPLSVAHFHLLCSREQLHGLHWVYLQRS